MGSREVFSHLSLLLSSTERIHCCSGILNIGARDPIAAALGARTLEEAYPGRVVVGMGVGHSYQAEIRGVTYTKPVARMRAYLDAMAGPEVGEGAMAPLLLAALGDRMLELARERALGAHSYFVPVGHTERARRVLGPEPVLAVEQTAVLATDREAGMKIARRFTEDYLSLPNYANNLMRLGFSEDDVAGAGSDRLVDATIAVGDVDAIASRVRTHLDAGADHVCLQLLGEAESDVCLPAIRDLAPAVIASAR
jgi:probable F420-dependent oxidoreductase